MTKLEKLVSKCRKGVYIRANDHLTSYVPVESYLKDNKEYDGVVEEMGQKIVDEMVERNSMIEIEFFPKSATTSFLVHHYDVELGLAAALKLYEEVTKYD